MANVKKSHRPAPLPEVLTPAEVRDWFLEHGMTKDAAAEQLNVSVQVVRDLLRTKGRQLKGHRGAAHIAAIGLRLKPVPRDGKTYTVLIV